MKKTLFVWMLALALLLSAGAAFASAETPSEAPAAFSPDGSVLFDKDGVKVTTAGLDTDPTTEVSEPIIWVDIENSGKEDVWLGVRDGSVNGTMATVVLIDFLEEEGGGYTGANYDFSLPVPAGSSARHALGYYRSRLPGAGMDTLGEMSFCFTEAKDEYSWPEIVSDPVTIVTGEEVEAVDLASLGTVAVDDDTLLLVVGDQDYDEFLGPLVYVYAENRTDHFLGISAEDDVTADGKSCDYVMYGDTLAPGKKSVSFMCFEGGFGQEKGFESLTVRFSIREGATSDEVDAQTKRVTLDPVTVRYPPQVWGEYENGGLRLEVRPSINRLITVETPADDPDGILLTASETASLEAGGFDGAGWLFSVGKVSADRLHEMLGSDMSGAEVIAKASDGGYYLYYHPTDVRYARATNDEMFRDQEQWTSVCDWASTVRDGFADANGLEPDWYGNTEIDMTVARAAWGGEPGVTLSTTEFGPVPVEGTDGTPYAETVLHSGFFQTDLNETPDGEYVVLNLPERNVRLDFFFAPGGYVRLVSGDSERLYQVMLVDDEHSLAQTMQDWYYAAAEHAGVKTPDAK